MTMLLMHVLVVPVRPVKDREGWFEFCGRPEFLDYTDVMQLPGTPVPARVIGLHDDEEICANDPRFSHDDDEYFRVTRGSAGGFLMGMLINTPEALVFEYMRDLDDPAAAVEFPLYKAGSIEKADARFAASIQEVKAKIAAPKPKKKKK